MTDENNNQDDLSNADSSHSDENYSSSEQEDYEFEENSKAKKSSMGFLDHLEELRRCLIKSVLAVVLFSFVAFYFADYIMEFIKIPLQNKVELYNIAVTGSFYAYLKVSLICGFIASLPFNFYQMWSFVAPGLYKKEKLLIIPLVFFSTILFLIGASFCYVVVFNTITIGSYISFVGLLLIAFGFGFQMPIVAYVLGKMGILSHEFLSKGRRYALVAILIVGAIITPPDVFTQFLLAIPLYILYEISIIIVKITVKKDKP